MNCSFGIFLNILTLLIVFTLLFVFYVIYSKAQSNNKDQTITASGVLTSLISEKQSIREITETSSIPKYEWPDDKKSGVGGSFRVVTPEMDNF